MGIRTASKREGRPWRAWAGCLLAVTLSLAVEQAEAVTSGDCVLSIVESSPTSAPVGGTVSFTIVASEGTNGSLTCGTAGLTITEPSDTTAGSALTTTPGSVSSGSPATATITLPAPPNGGGAVTYNVNCNAGCEGTPLPDLTFTVNVDDFYQMTYDSPADGNANVTGGGSVGLSAFMTKNGSGSGIGPEGDVCFEFSNNPYGATMSGGSGPCGVGGRLVSPTPGTGALAVTLNAPPEICAETQIEANAASLPTGPLALTYFVYGNGIETMSVTGGDNQTAFVNQNFPQPNVVQVLCGSTPPSSGSVDWNLAAPTGTQFSGGGTSSVTLPIDAGGFSTAQLVAGSSTGFVSLGACLTASGCDVNASFSSLQVANFHELTHVLPADGNATGLPSETISLTARLSIDGTPVSSEQISWTVHAGPDPGVFITPSSVLTDANGDAPVSWSSATEGNYVLRASYVGSLAKASSGAPPIELDFNVLVQLDRTLASPTATQTSGTVGQTATLTVTAQDDGGLPSPGSPVNWEVVSGDGMVSPASSGTDSATGNASTTFTFGATPGAVSVRAFRLNPDNSLADEVFFSLENFRYVLAHPAVADASPSGMVSTAIPMNAVLRREGISTTTVDGLSVHYVIVSSPAGASAFLDPAADVVTAGGGLASVGLNADSPGTYQARAEYPMGAPTTMVNYTVTVTEQSMVFHAQPAGPNYTEETIAGVVTQTVVDSGGSLAGEDGVPVTFEIVGSTATFVGGATTANVLSAGGGFATSPGIVIGRDLTSVAVRATSAGRPTVDFTLPVTASTYSIRLDASQPNPASTSPNVAAPISVVVERTGSGGAEPLSARAVNWTASGGSLASASSLSNASGVATNSFTAVADGSYTVTASFEPGFGALPASTTQVTVDVATLVREVVAIAGGGQAAFAGQPLPAALEVEARDDGGVPPSPVTINWSVLPAGAATFDNAATITDPSTGRAQVNVTLAPSAASGPITIIATRSDSGATASFAATVSTVRTLTKPASDSGDGQSATVNSALPLPLKAIALDDGNAAPGVQVNWSVSGNAVLSATQTTTGTTGETSVFVTLGGTPQSITITASRGDEPAATTSFVVTALADTAASLTVAGGNNQRGLVGQPATPLQVLYTVGGVAQAGVPVSWTVSQGTATLAAASSNTAADGTASVGLTYGSTPGPIVVTASAGGASVSFALEAVAAQILIESGDGQSGEPGNALPEDFVARVSVPAPLSPVGMVVTWQVTGGGGTLSTTSSTAGADGLVSTRLTLGANGGANVVRATVAGGNSVDFTANAIGVTVVAASGGGQSGTIQTTGALPLVAEVQDADGVALGGRAIAWSAPGGNGTVESANGVTDNNGQASVEFRYGDVAGPVVFRATDVDSGAFADFVVEATQPTLGGPTQGGGQTAAPGQQLPQDFVVSIVPSGRKSLAGVVVQWEVTQGGGSLRSASTVTDANGSTSNRLTLGPEPGLNEVRASIPGAEPVVFQAEAVGLGAGTLRIVSGDAQTVPTNDPSQPLVVELVDASEGPIRGTRIRWTALPVDIAGVSQPNATVQEEFTTTDDDGRSSNTARILLSGPAKVQAQVEFGDIAPVVFELNGGVANLPNLTVGQEQVGGAVDSACPALEQLSNRTPEQEDLYQRCLELIESAGDDPAATGIALGELAQQQLNKSMAEAGFETLDAQSQNLNTRFQALRQQGGNNQFNVGLMTGTGVLPLGFLPSALGGDDDEGGGEVGSDFDRWGFFATGTIGRGKSEGEQGDPGFDFDTSGLTAGVDYRFSDRLVGGVSIGYARHDSELQQSAGSLDTSGLTVSGYASWYNATSWYVDGVLSYGINSYDIERRIQYSIAALDGTVTDVDQRATADSDGSLLGVAVSIGRDFQKGPWSFSTYLRGNFDRIELDAYDEELIAGLPGAGLGLHFDSRTLDSIRSSLGGKATYIMSRDWGILMPHAQVEWEHEFSDDPARVTARFINDPTNTLIEQFGNEQDSDYFNVGVGLSALFPGGRSVYLYYERLVGASQLSQSTLSIGGRFEF